MKTAKYIIVLTANTAEHRQVKQQINALYEKLRFELEGDIDYYIQSIIKKKSKGLHTLGKGTYNVWSGYEKKG